MNYISKGSPSFKMISLAFFVSNFQENISDRMKLYFFNDCNFRRSAPLPNQLCSIFGSNTLYNKINHKAHHNASAHLLIIVGKLALSELVHWANLVF